ncbi:MAG: major facilitator superfamily 1 [Frankiales bacterium]|nr:major facilitator superfamily 1 [Frankiales bacterium]
MTNPPPAETYEPDPMRWKALVICLIAGFMALLDVSIVNVAIPSISAGLHAGESSLQWIVSGYALTFGLLLVPAGRIGDARGRRPAFMWGLSLFTLASVLCGLAPNDGTLIAARLLQGAAGGVLMPQMSGLIQQLFRGAERGRAFGLLGASIGISTAVGPLLGGLIIQVFGASEGWRFVFFVNLPIGLVTLVLAMRWMPHVRPTGRRESLDPVGVLLLGSAVTCVLLPFIEQEQWHSHLRLLLFPAAAALGAAWLAWEISYAKRSDPVVDLDLFREKGYGIGAGLGLVFFAGFTGLFFIYTQYLQIGLHYSALDAGLAVTPFALGSAAAAALGGRVVLRYGRPLVVVGLVLVVLGFVGCYIAADAVPGHNVGWAAVVPLLVAGVGSGLVITPNVTLTLQEVPVRRAGIAGGVLQTGQRIGSAAGIAMTGSVFYAAVRTSRGDWALAFRHGLWVITAFTVAALALGVLDLTTSRRPVS